MRMTNSKVFLRVLAPMVLALIGGCASAYHSYSECCIPCQYCPPPPLPYTQYSECVCHSCAASKYLAIQPQVVTADDDPADNIDVPE